MNTQKPSNHGGYDRAEVLIEGNHIYFKGDVENSSVLQLIKAIKKYNTDIENNRKFITTDFLTKYKDDKDHKDKLLNLKLGIVPDPIYLHIMSYGGSILAAMSAIDAIKNSKIPIYTVIDGFAASAGTMMSVMGKKRYMTSHSYALIHQLSSSAWGTMQTLIDSHENHKMFMERIKKIYIEKTKLTPEELEEQLKHDIWWDIDTCIAKGLVDEIYTDC